MQTPELSAGNSKFHLRRPRKCATNLMTTHGITCGNGEEEERASVQHGTDRPPGCSRDGHRVGAKRLRPRHDHLRTALPARVDWPATVSMWAGHGRTVRMTPWLLTVVWLRSRPVSCLSASSVPPPSVSATAIWPGCRSASLDERRPGLPLRAPPPLPAGMTVPRLIVSSLDTARPHLLASGTLGGPPTNT